jgi:isoleucyl-tRNA synthetase
MFEEIENESFAARETRILKFWQDERIFQRSLEQREKASYFTFYDGPPFATGLPHYGHLLAGTIKDVVPRYKTMKGYYVPRRFGWDCHGLPIENAVEKEWSLSGASAVEAFGIGRFNEECRKIVLRYTEEWKSKVERFGRWVDFSKVWKTMDRTFMESVWWVFKQIYDKGLIYEGFKVMPFSAKLGTPLSNFEASENYQEIDDPSIVVAFPLAEDPQISLLAWTTTPWTLVSNMALAVGSAITYVKICYKGHRYVLAEAALPRWFKESNTYTIESRFLGQELVGKTYAPPFTYFLVKGEEGAFRILAGDFVSTEDGTGIVHTAPAFGEADFFACQKEGVPLVCPVDNNGRFTAEIPEYVGQFVKDADKAIIARLKQSERLFYRGTLRHRYPFCWRSDTPLIYKAITTWFLQVVAIKDHMVVANRQIHWMPEHIKEGRFGNWLEGARDWAISRNRYWGTPIPLWRAEDGTIHVVGSVAELEELTGEKIVDLHRHFIDHLTFVKEGKIFRRIPEVFDCWFDAGSMPYAQNHYPFENKELTEKHFPADFIAEGVDQTRGWFYTLTILAVALFDQPAFKNVVVNGILLAEDGNKMSKRLKNYPEPELVVDKYGADAVRLYMLSSPAVKGDDLRFSEKGVELVLRQFLIPLWNAHVFFSTYARIYDWNPEEDVIQRWKEINHRPFPKPKAKIDQWILSLLHKLIEDVEKGMDAYDLSRAVEPLVGFIDQLTNWYIRRNRRRFWADVDTPDRQEAFGTLYEVLVELCKIAAPFIPFLSEAIYRNLVSRALVPDSLSVHLCDYPKCEESYRNERLEEEMNAVQVIVSLGHALRKEHQIKVRQPLSCAHVICADPQLLQFLDYQGKLIEDELNVKEVKLHQESHRFVKYSIKPHFRVLGKKVGGHMKEAQLLIATLDQEQIDQLMWEKSLPVVLGGAPFTLMSEDVEITRQVQDGWIAMNAGGLTIAIETELNETLILEGIARELVNKINTMRRMANFAVTDRIRVMLGATDKVKKAFSDHRKYIEEEVLAIEVRFGQPKESTLWDINGEPTSITIEKVSA